MWNTWTWAAEEFLVVELNEDSRMESVLQQQWPGPLVLKRAARALEKRDGGTQSTTAVTKLFPNKKTPNRAPKTKAI